MVFTTEKRLKNARRAESIPLGANLAKNLMRVSQWLTVCLYMEPAEEAKPKISAEAAAEAERRYKANKKKNDRRQRKKRAKGDGEDDEDDFFYIRDDLRAGGGGGGSHLFPCPMCSFRSATGTIIAFKILIFVVFSFQTRILLILTLRKLSFPRCRIFLANSIYSGLNGKITSFLMTLYCAGGGRASAQPNKAVREDGTNFGNIIYQQTGLALTDQQAGTVKELNRKMISNSKLNKDKSDRATTEQVMDPRTRMILYKLMNKGVIKAIHGCVSTGKEANVYHAILDTDEEIAIKIYKTSILVFKDRDQYVFSDPPAVPQLFCLLLSVFSYSAIICVRILQFNAGFFLYWFFLSFFFFASAIFRAGQCICIGTADFTCTVQRLFLFFPAFFFVSFSFFIFFSFFFFCLIFLFVFSVGFFLECFFPVFFFPSGSRTFSDFFFLVRYVTGEFRFRRGYSKSNPRKMVRVWAEKEMRNLIRMDQAGIPCPEPILLKNHVLVMSFLGKDGAAAPRLKDADLTQEQYDESYVEICKSMRLLYHKCRLVHGDLRHVSSFFVFIFFIFFGFFSRFFPRFSDFVSFVLSMLLFSNFDFCRFSIFCRSCFFFFGASCLWLC